MKIEVLDKGRKRTFRVKAIDELNVREWADLMVPAMDLGEDPEAAYTHTLNLVKRHTGIPDDLLRRMPIGQVDAIITAMVGLVDDMNAATAEAKRIAKAWSEEGPNHWTWKGVTYTVPQNLETDTTFDQWMFIQAHLGRLQWEAQAMSVVCAALLIPKGEEWDNDEAAGRVALYDEAPALLPLRVASFFLSRSDRLRTAVEGSMSRMLTSKLRSLEQELQSMTEGTASGLC